MRKVSLAATLLAWMKLILSGRKRVSEVPGTGPLLDGLEKCLARAKDLDSERLRLRAEQQRITRELRETREEGDELMVRIRSSLKGTYGRQSPRLHEFDMRPHPRRYRPRAGKNQEEES